MDRRHILRIILSDDHDPFNRLSLKPDDLVPQTELKEEIKNFCQEHNIEYE
jgi:ubiquitin conjugation factor E4 B